MATANRKTTQPRAGWPVIVDSAVREFHQRGYHATSMRDIARGAEITVSSIYHHFPSKQEILQKIMISTMQELIADTRSALVAAPNSPRTQLSAIVRAFVLFHTRRQAESVVGSTEIRSLDEHGRRLVIALRDEQEAMFREVISRGVVVGDFDTEYGNEAARSVLNMGSAIAAWYRPGGSVSPEALAEEYVDIALGAVWAKRDQAADESRGPN